MLGPLPGTTRLCPITGKPLFFYPSFVVPKSKPGDYRWVLNASYNRWGTSINDHILDYSTRLVSFKDSLYPCLRTRFISRIDLRRAFKQLFRAISQLHLLATKIGDDVFIDATMSMGLRNTCKLFEEDFMNAFVKGPRLIFRQSWATCGRLSGRYLVPGRIGPEEQVTAVNCRILGKMAGH